MPHGSDNFVSCTEVVLIENLFGIIIFIVFILLRVLGQRKTPPPPRRSQRPPVENQERDWVEPRPRRVEPRPPVESPRPVDKREAEDDEFFPIPEDLREIFGLPSRGKRESQQEKPKPVFEPAVGPEWVGDVNQPFITASEKSRQASGTISQQPVPRKSARTVIPGLGVPMNKKSIIQGIIWSEVLNNPRTRKNKRYPGRI